MFNPEHGRILADEYQLLYIVEGKGVLQTRAAGNFRVGGGDMFMLFPGEWHSYMPDESTGWNGEYRMERILDRVSGNQRGQPGGSRFFLC